MYAQAESTLKLVILAAYLQAILLKLATRATVPLEGIYFTLTVYITLTCMSN